MPPKPPKPPPGGDCQQGGSGGSALRGSASPGTRRAFGWPWPTQPQQEPRGSLWLWLIVPRCPLLFLAGTRALGCAGDPTLSAQQRIHIRGSGWEHPRTQERCQGAGDARLCQVSVGGLQGPPLPSDTGRGAMDAPELAALCPRCCHIHGHRGIT